MNRVGSVGIAPRLQAGQPRKPDLISGSIKRFFYSRKRPDQLWGAPRHLGTGSKSYLLVMACTGTTSPLPLKEAYPHILTVVIARSKAGHYNRGFEIHSGINMCLCHFSWCCPVQVRSLRPVKRSCKPLYHMSTNKTEMPKNRSPGIPTCPGQVSSVSQSYTKFL